ncbi:TNF receptor-associated factor 2-like isoform X2 [Lineus longissimus]|uniref:TNF receptor-associated factor 2-like isoform X2 n=1 Tax=Lineus longissimus TaxID=88925 RepID=UPI00315CD833
MWTSLLSQLCHSSFWMFPDRAVEKEIQQKKVKCPNQGCIFQGICRGYDEHEQQCRFKPAICRRCENSVPESMLEEHMKTDCPERIIKCRFCQQSFRNIDKEQHNYSCPKFPLRCGGCEKTKIPRDVMNDHILSCETACPYQCLGCAPVPVRDLPGHFKEHSQNHQLLLIKGVLGKDNKLAQEVDNYLKSSVGGLEGRLRVVEQGGASAGPLSARNEECYQQLVVHTEVIKVLKNEISTLHQACNTVAEGAQAQQSRIVELENKVRQLERTLSLKDVGLAEQDLRIRSLELTSYEGTLLWKITDFKKKRDEAIAGRTISVYSPAFYTSRTGYKMCGRIYLNGDGMGKGSHISLFFVIMRGHYDNIQKWPFRQKVTFMLLDQNQHEHVIDAFRPDPNSTSFKCPTSEMNIASGCPLFVPLTHLENASSAYVKDDTIFIKIIVDCSDLN